MNKTYKLFVALAMLFSIVGALAWGIFGITRFGSGGFLLVDFLAHWQSLANVVYIIVEIFGLLSIPSFIHWVRS